MFAYGQTGAGKTYTMEGPGDDQPGIIRNAFSHAFNQISRTPEKVTLRHAASALMRGHEISSQQLSPGACIGARVSNPSDAKSTPFGSSTRSGGPFLYCGLAQRAPQSPGR